MILSVSFRSKAPTNTSFTGTGRFIRTSTGIRPRMTSPMATAAERLKAIIRTTLTRTGAIASTTLMMLVRRSSGVMASVTRFSSKRSGRIITNQPAAKATIAIQKRCTTRSATPMCAIAQPRIMPGMMGLANSQM